MSGSLHTWYSLPDLDALAERDAVLSGEIDLKRFARLRDMLHTDSGSVRVSLRFRRRSAAWLVLELDYDTTLQLLCQRCLEPMSYCSAAQVEMGLLESASVESCLPENYEPVVLDGERLMPAQLIEDELIVSLPLVARHSSQDQCASLIHDLNTLNHEAGVGTLGCAPH